MPEQTASALPQFLRLLTTHPAPSDVARALVRGLLSRYQAMSSAIWISLGDHSLEVIGEFATAPDAIDRYGQAALRVDLPVTRSWHTGSVVSGRLADLAGRFPALAIDPQMWTDANPAVYGSSLVCAPVLLGSTSIGAWGFSSRAHLELDSTDEHYLLGIAHALGLWMSHPNTTVPVSRYHDGDGEQSLSLSARQSDILVMVLAGHSNAQIGQELGFSASTVKQELHRVMQSMRTTDRFVAAERAWELGLIDAPDHPRALPQVTR